MTYEQHLWDGLGSDGQPRRQLDVSRAEKEFGFKAKTGFEKGLKKPLIGIQSKRGTTEAIEQ